MPTFQFETNFNVFNLGNLNNSNTNNRFNNSYNNNRSNNSNNNIRFNNFFNNLEEHLYSELSIVLKFNNNDKCSLCSKIFNANEKNKNFSCKKHIFHSSCLKDFLIDKFLFHINPTKCQKCIRHNNNFSINIQYNPFVPINNLSSHFRLPNLRSRLYNDRMNYYGHSTPNLDDSSDNPDNDNFDDEVINFEDDLDLVISPSKGLNKEFLDNMEISKIKNVEKLDNDKKNVQYVLKIMLIEIIQ